MDKIEKEIISLDNKNITRVKEGNKKSKITQTPEEITIEIK